MLQQIKNLVNEFHLNAKSKHKPFTKSLAFNVNGDAFPGDSIKTTLDRRGVTDRAFLSKLNEFFRSSVRKINHSPVFIQFIVGRYPISTSEFNKLETPFKLDEQEFVQLH